MRSLKEYRKIIDKWYYKDNDQMCYITTDTVKEDNKDCVDIILYNKKTKDTIWLFEICNLNMAESSEIHLRTCFKPQKFVQLSYLSEYSNKPLYFDHLFFLKKFTEITDDDILNCMLYFIRIVLNVDFLIWNYKMLYYNEREQLENEIKNK